MAEFTEVMKHAARMCGYYNGCAGCPAEKDTWMCGNIPEEDGEHIAEFERVVLSWAAEHQTPRYPTWNEWQKSTFPDAESGLSPCEFGLMRRFDCNVHDCCYDCAEQPIPADIAAKLGIRPIEEGKSI